MLAVILLASAAGYALSRLLPWSSAARIAGVPGAVGFALGPFLLGAGSVLVLGLLPGRSHATHLISVVVGLLVLMVLAVWRGGSAGQTTNARVPKQFGEYLLSGLLVLWLVLLLINSIFIPLMQNDPLEYATVARLLYETRELGSYPAINPEQSTSGFFGPWTHPPLYVSLSYLTQVIQGNADEPGFMRLIAPWFAACATFLILALGSLLNRLTGLISAVIFLSTPLLFASADSAMIDALPVLGIGLVAVTILCIEAKPAVRGLVTGIAVALGLWTHSQGVLFAPLAVGAVALQNGMERLRITLLESATLVATAFLLGSWPYWRNLRIFGSPISDNPAVFALPSLDWPSYFAYARGLDNWAAIVQYGLFKGWFSLESYGWTFWLMTLGAGVAIKRLRQPTFRATVISGGRQALDPGAQVLWLSLILVMIYLGGVLTSLLMGLDLMIKNERYMLVILPFVALLAGYGGQVFLGRGAMIIENIKVAPAKRDFCAFVGFLLVMVILVQLVVLGWYSRWRPIMITVQDNPVEIERNQQQLKKSIFQRRLEFFPNFAAMYWVRDNLPQDALVLSLRPADMYYAQRKMVSYLDERMLPIYRESSPQRAAQLLRDLGVTHLHVPDYALPVSYNSVLGRIIADPALTPLIYSAAGTQIFRLELAGTSSGASVVTDSTDFTPGQHKWSVYRQLNLGGAKAMQALGFVGQRLPDDGVSSIRWALPLFHRSFSSIVANGVGSPMGFARPDSLQPVRGGQEYRITFDLEGRAFVRVWIAQFDGNGMLLRSSDKASGIERISETVMNKPDETKRISRRFITLPSAAYVRFGIEHLGYSRIQVQKAVLEQLKVQE